MKSFILFLLFSVSLCQNSTTILPRILSNNQLQQILTKSVKASVIYSYSAVHRCDSCLRDIESLFTSLDGIVQAYILYCEPRNSDFYQDLEICQNYRKKAATLPEVSFIEPLGNETYKKHMLRLKDLDFKFLKSFAVKMAPTYSTQLKTEQELQDYLKDSKHGFNKVLFFYKTPEIPIVYKGVTSDYISRLQFAHVSYRHKEVIDKYQITDFPTLLLLKRNIAKENDFFKFEFKNTYNISNIAKFLNKYAFPQKIKQHAAPMTQEVKNYLFKYEEFEKEWESIQEKNFNATLGFEQFKTEKLTLVHITSGKVSFPLYSQLVEKLSNTVNLVLLNTSKKSENIIFAEKILKVKIYPALHLYKYKNSQLYNFTIPLNQSLNEALKRISDNLEDRSNPVKSEDNLEFYMKKAFEEEKIGVVLFHDEDVISMSFRAFGHISKFKNHYKFLNFKNPSESLKNKYGIKKLPKMMAIVPQNMITSEGGTLVVGYDGNWVYHEMAKFLHHVLIKYKGDELGNLVINLDSQKMFEDLCLSEKHLFCLIGFFEFANERNMNQAKKYMEILKKLKMQFYQINFHVMWVNATCHKDIVKPFGLADKKLPQIVLYNHYTSKFANHKKDLVLDQLTSFVMTFLKSPNELGFYGGKSSFFKDLDGKCDDQKSPPPVEKFRRKDEL